VKSQRESEIHPFTLIRDIVNHSKFIDTFSIFIQMRIFFIILKRRIRVMRKSATIDKTYDKPKVRHIDLLILKSELFDSIL
jgi:hypothetical protein